MQKTSPALGTLFIVILLAGCGEGELARGRYAIVNGKPYTGHPSVGMVRDEGGGFCTGTLVGKRTVVSAAHCVFPELSYSFEVGGESYPVVRARAHPGYSELLDLDANDISIFRLGETPAVEPSAIAGAAPSVGLAVTLVGFGVTGEGLEDGEVKRVGTNTIGWVLPKEIGWDGSSSTSTGCYGDSGGPAFATVNGEEVQVGIVSRGTGACGSGEVDTRVDAYRAWLMHESGGDLLVGGLPVSPESEPAPEPAPTAVARPPSVLEAPSEICGSARDCQRVEPAPAPEPRARLELGCAVAPGPPSPALLLALLLFLAARVVRRKR